MDRTGRAFCVPVSEIRSRGYELGISAYKEAAVAQDEHESPAVILGRLRDLEGQIDRELTELQAMLK